jgi:hypothetical protein
VALFLVHSTSDREDEVLASIVRGVTAARDCQALGNNGEIDVNEARRLVRLAVPRPTQTFAILTGYVENFGPEFPPEKRGQENIQWALLAANPAGKQSFDGRRVLLSPLSELMPGRLRCFQIHHAPIVDDELSHDTQTCDLDPDDASGFFHISEDAHILSIEAPSRFFGGDASVRRAMAAVLLQYLAHWPNHEPF